MSDASDVTEEMKGIMMEITPLPEYKNRAYELYALDKGHTVEEQMDADRVDGVVRYDKFLEWVGLCKRQYIGYGSHGDAFVGALFLFNHQGFLEYLESCENARVYHLEKYGY